LSLGVLLSSPKSPSSDGSPLRSRSAVDRLAGDAVGGRPDAYRDKGDVLDHVVWDVDFQVRRRSPVAGSARLFTGHSHPDNLAGATACGGSVADELDIPVVHSPSGFMQASYMPVPKHGITLCDSSGHVCDLDEIIEQARKTPARVIVDDELSIAVDISGLGFMVASMHWESGESKKTPVSVLRKRKKPSRILRITTASGTAIDAAEDTLFHVSDESGTIRHVRADMLKSGMEILAVEKDDGTPGFVVY